MTVYTKTCQKCNKIIEYSPTGDDRVAACPRCSAAVHIAGCKVDLRRIKDDFTTFTSALGNLYVRYQCLRCGENLRSPVEEAGSINRCSFCRVELVVPGNAKLNPTSKISESSEAAQQLQRDSELEMLTTQLENTCRLEMARAEITTQQIVKQLEAIYVQAISDLGLKKKISKEMAVMRFTASVVETINKVKCKNWPEFLVNETIAEILDLRNRVVDSIVRRNSKIEAWESE